MAKRQPGREVIVKLIVGAGQASPSPPVGPALGSKGVKSMDFCKEFNALTAAYTPGTPIPALITVRPDRTFHFTLRTPPTATLLLLAAGVPPSKGAKLRGANAPGRATSETTNTSAPAFRTTALASSPRTSPGGGSLPAGTNTAPSLSARAGREVGMGVVKAVAKSAGGDKEAGHGGGSAQVGEVSLKHVYEIARIKQSEERLKGMSLEGLVKSVVAQARSVGVIPDNTTQYKHKDGGSANFANISVVLAMCKKLAAVYGNKINEKLMVLTPYKASEAIYRDKFKLWRRQAQVPKTCIPRIMTIDSASESQASHVIVDITIGNATKKSQLGFIKEDTRAVVLTTRGEEIIWVVSGVIQGDLHNKRPRKLLVDLYRECARRDCVYTVTPPSYQVPIPSAFQRVGVSDKPITDADAEGSEPAWGSTQQGNEDTTDEFAETPKLLHVPFGSTVSEAPKPDENTDPELCCLL